MTSSSSFVASYVGWGKHFGSRPICIVLLRRLSSQLNESPSQEKIHWQKGQGQGPSCQPKRCTTPGNTCRHRAAR
eukprot:14647864-Alexandrium_andersonii.AAC.1